MSIIQDDSVGGPAPQAGLFDLSKFKVSQRFAESTPVKKELMTIPVRKPDKQEFVRVRPGEEWRGEFGILELKEEGAFYLIEGSIYPELSKEVALTLLLTAISRFNNLFLWPIKVANTEGKWSSWPRSALAAAKTAEESWIRVISNRDTASYDPYVAPAKYEEPEWPAMSFQEIIGIAFKDRVIATLDHPVIKRLQGKV